MFVLLMKPSDVAFQSASTHYLELLALCLSTNGANQRLAGARRVRDVGDGGSKRVGYGFLR